MIINSHKLNLAMAKACISAKQLQLESNVSDVTIARIRKGNHQVHPRTAGRLAKTLNIAVEDLIEEA